MKLIRYDFARYGSAAERRRLLENGIAKSMRCRDEIDSRTAERDRR